MPVQLLGSMVLSERRQLQHAAHYPCEQALQQWPLSLQANHFVRYAPEQIEYAKNRYVNETNRLYQVHEAPSQRPFLP